ncbi:hypothetical protein K437DRAFT_226828 [Tilletiaria anomala UBC 951]|uniref:PAN2-PAN3 deadenylation complex catalytic subunit PAN2 n=1 Tax=Tilletiaria anomala (strain ATCC 24038 / CBS 436.72 / UBC 951) TaxID=1037660 RepID=A0A066VI21_TILAU|nr:uncharacterized protein K437DRAFT_226828 [Tilletiaria anomala UBC 951]KDN41342.1 hypothetical protein K437DRAFT_226828 [Tilletiaria anomala UBC 951]
MTDWAECNHVLANNSPPGVLGSVTALAFDRYSELLWVGSASGQLSAHYSADLQRYTSFAAHGTLATPSPLKALLLDERLVYSTGESGLHAASRRGLTRWSAPAKSHAPTLTLSGMTASPLAASSDLIAGGLSQQLSHTGTPGPDDVLLVVNKNSGSVVRTVASDAPILHLRKSSRLVCAGTSGGHIQLRDPRSLAIEHRLHAHPGGLIDIAAEGNLIYSIGWTVRLGHPVAEPLVKVHDLRTMRALVPIPFAASGGPAMLTVHPKLASTVIVAAPQGQFQIVDTGNPGEGMFYQMNTRSYATCMDMSPSGDFLAFGEGDGSVRLWSSSPDPSPLRFNMYDSDPPEAADAPEAAEPVNWTPAMPLSSIGLPYYKEPLLSYLNYDNYGLDSSALLRPTPKLDSAVLATMRVVDGLGYAPLPKQLRGQRNLVKTPARGKDRRRIGAPLFRSEQEREAARRAAAGIVDSPAVTAGADAPSSPSATTLTGEGVSSMPSYYRLQTIQYSKFGIEDFDFGFYNKTPFSGLETHIQNSYANAYLQALHYLAPLRTLAQSHITQECEREHCLLCEAGFLFRMLTDAKGANCQATNFLRAFGNIPRSASLGLLDKDESPGSDQAYANLVQSLNRFVLDSFVSEAVWGSTSDGRQNLVRRAIGIDAVTKTSCGSCGVASERESKSHVVDLIYPRKALSNETALPSDFASVLKESLTRPTTSKTMCRSCKATNVILKSRRVFLDESKLPVVLSINAAVHTEDQLQHWLSPSRRKGGEQRPYLPAQVEFGLHGDDLTVRGIWDESEAAAAGSIRYVLRSLIVQIQDDKDAPHLVALERVPDSEREQAEGKGPWYLFNDFLVRNISDMEARSFNGPWKVPAVLFFERADAATALDLSSLPLRIPPSILCQDINISKHRDPARSRHKVLSATETLSAGTMIAIDSEFVALSQEETEVRSDGTRSLIRPTRSSLARVSVVRGQGEKADVPFIDDHIYTREQVVDYLTQFSGIVHGDLDPETSRHTLVPLKTAYKKLRLLVDLGCVFIGHGLSKDFRIINIHVPASQVVDTVDLFHSASHPRKLSLKFLSWFLLKRDIQSGTSEEGHDSIEDASAALQLYELYENFKRDNRLDDVMEDLYEEGRRMVSIAVIAGTLQRSGQADVFTVALMTELEAAPSPKSLAGCRPVYRRYRRAGRASHRRVGTGTSLAPARHLSGANCCLYYLQIKCLNAREGDMRDRAVRPKHP